MAYRTRMIFLKLCSKDIVFTRHSNFVQGIFLKALRSLYMKDKNGASLVSLSNLRIYYGMYLMIIFVILSTSSLAFAFVFTDALGPIKVPGKFSVTEVTPSQRQHSTGLSGTGRWLGKRDQASDSINAVYYSRRGRPVFPIEVGYPPVKLLVNFDTAHADTWVLSSRIPQSQRRSQAVYDPHQSDLYWPMPNTFAAKYADNSWARGGVTIEVVRLGKLAPMRAVIGLASEASGDILGDAETQGTVGLTYSPSQSSIQPHEKDLFFQSISDILAEPVFAAQFGREGNPTSFDFGAIDASKYTGDLIYEDVVSDDGTWTFSLKRIFIGQRPRGPMLTHAKVCMIDTGTIFIYVSDYVGQGYYATVLGALRLSRDAGMWAGLWILPCSSTPSDFSIVTEQHEYIVPGNFIMLNPLNPKISRWCLGGIQVTPNMPKSWIVLGEIFLQTKYVVFNGTDRPRVGFAEQANGRRIP